MATVGTAVTMLDIQNRLDPDGDIAKLIEILKRRNAILEDMMWQEGNLPTGNKTTIRTGLPDSTWRLFNYGVQPTKSTGAPVTDTCGMLREWAEVDAEMVQLQNNARAFRLSEDMAHIQAMNNSFATAMFYGNQSTDPEQITGLAPRYNSISTDVNNIGYQVVSAGGSASTNTSIFACTWSDLSMFGIYPKGSVAGLKMEDKGIETKLDAAGGLYEVYRTYYKWDCGLTVRDWRNGARLANIDVSALTTNAATGANLMTLLTKLYYRLDDPSMGNTVMYCNRTIQEYLHHQAAAKANVNLTLDTVDGKPVVRWIGIPIKRCDAIVNTESTVS